MHLRRIAHVGLIAVATLGCPAVAATNPIDVQVARYSSVRAVPTVVQTDPLADVVTIDFASLVESVGAAVAQLLKGSGYRIANDAATQSDRMTLFELPLPHAHRSLGPLPLRLLLQTLAGPGYRLIEDPVHRLITFERCSGPAPSVANIELE